MGRKIVKAWFCYVIVITITAIIMCCLVFIPYYYTTIIMYFLMHILHHPFYMFNLIIYYFITTYVQFLEFLFKYYNFFNATWLIGLNCQKKTIKKTWILIQSVVVMKDTLDKITNVVYIHTLKLHILPTYIKNIY